MTTLRAFVARLGGAITQRRRDAALDEEIAAHLDLLTAELVSQGLPEEEARRQARRSFGGVAAMKDSVRDERGLPALESIAQDVRYTLRQLQRQPGFAAAAILTLAVGIGGTTGIFSIVDVAMLRPLPYSEPERLVVIQEGAASQGPGPVSPADADVWRRSASSLETIALTSPEGVSLTGAGEPERLPGERVSAAFFRLLGVRTQQGRTFLDSEETSGNDRVAIISDALWRRRFNSAPDIVGTSILLDGVGHTVVGVLAAGERPPYVQQLLTLSFGTVRPPELWRPLALTAEQRPAIGNYSYAALARLTPGVSLEQARAELSAVQTNLVREVPNKGDVRAFIAPLHDQILSRSRAGLQILFLAVAAILLIGCANIANLLLAHALVRRREMAVRQALGASRRRLVRQLLIENITLIALGGLAALPVAYGVTRVIAAYAPAGLPRVDEAALDGRVLLFALGSACLSAVLVGVLPAWRLGQIGLTDAMKVRSGGSGNRATSRVRSLLVAAQIGASAACLVVAGLLLQSFIRLMNVDKGFAVERLVTLELWLPAQHYPDGPARLTFINALVERSRALPGVINASGASRLPLSGTGANSAVSRDGTTVPVPERPLADLRSVTPGYFRTVGLPVLSGRTFTTADVDGRAVVVSETLARKAWPGENALGQRFRFGSNPNAPLSEVVGVVGAARNRSLGDDPTMTAYLPYPTATQGLVAVLIHMSPGAPVPAEPLRQLVRALDAELPIATLRTLDDIASGAEAPRRFQLQLILGFAIAAGLLAALGVYGVMAYAVTQRRTEFGVRLALGARPDSVLGLVLRDSARLVVGGLAVAAIVVLALESLLRGLLFGIGTTDPRTLLAVAVVTTLFAMTAAYVPGRRASRLDPTTALRAE